MSQIHFFFFLKERTGKNKYVIKEISIAISIDFMNTIQKILVAASGSKKSEYGPTCMDRSVWRIWLSRRTGRITNGWNDMVRAHRLHGGIQCIRHIEQVNTNVWRWWWWYDGFVMIVRRRVPSWVLPAMAFHLTSPLNLRYEFTTNGMYIEINDNL